tara:strand:+ start:1310 stop:1531 length:222 start_codon:yes stop_codon:yes gene_type:complete
MDAVKQTIKQASLFINVATDYADIEVARNNHDWFKCFNYAIKSLIEEEGSPQVEKLVAFWTKDLIEKLEKVNG